MPIRPFGSATAWRAAALLGLISSTFSTLVSQFTAARIGRDAMVDWMVVAAIPLRDAALQAEPSWAVVVAGILFHQWADFSWALVFFGLLGRWTAGLSPATLLVLCVPWALLTSCLEWFVLVPLLPFRQPLFTLEQPYWIGFLVHLTSASIYPLFPALRDRVEGRRPSPHRRFCALWAGLAAAGASGLGVLALLGWLGWEVPHLGDEVAYDQSYLRRMTEHHEQGAQLAALAAERAEDPRLRALAGLMAAAQAGEIAVMMQWWDSWFAPASPLCTPQEREAMPGMAHPEQVAALRRSEGRDFDALFVALISRHHAGAVQMADEALARAGDPRIRLLSHAIRHQQRGEIDLMHGRRDLAAVASATRNLLLPFGRVDADRALTDAAGP
ncbi:hypothetical protein VQ02_23225 [Methylobacterium variabile]|jgi:uncharacterized protein (DUF305 family)|uniref:DUF305 domain-containing protein n=1 Tax=Methylobacterium variabile TaxID=298794 RepID=A0A0J6SFY6_9HYPH|nr:DUF305 domain-containing protein [Methylobacterium variabile]KMO32632.1 hypothetical protein VQ02_23225 [Methylobacterium variabile]